MKQKIVLMLALLTFCLVQNPAQAQGIFTPEEILSKYSSDPNSVVGLIMKVKFTGTSSTNWEVKSGTNTIAFRKDDNPDLNANTEYVALTTFTAIEGQPGWYKATGSSYTPSKAKEPESPCNRHYESAVKFIVDTPVVHTFTVNGRTGAKVIFSPGILQYRPATNEWRFALRQFDRVGYGTSRHLPEGMTGGTGVNDNTSTVFYDSIDYANKDENGNYKVIKNVPCNNLLRSKTYQGWIDMFAWGTSGQGRKVGDKYTVFYYPYEVSSADFGEPNNYGYGPSYGEGHGEGASSNNIDKKSGMNRLFDWGYANYIREYNGSVFDDQGHWQYSSDSTMYHTGIWRTPTIDEWKYMLTSRIVDGNDSAFTYVRLQWGKNDYDTVSGMIIYPDGFSFSEAGVANLPFGAKTLSVITMPTWEALQEAGCVFCPSMSGLSTSETGLTTTIGNMGTIVYAGWSSTTPSATNGKIAYINNFAINADGNSARKSPRPVRLVQDYYDPCGLVNVEYRDTAVVLCESDGRTFTWVKGNKSEDVSIPANETQKDFYDTIKSELGVCDSIAYHLNLRIISTEWNHDTTIAQLNSTFQWQLPHKTKPCEMIQDKMDFYDTLRSQVIKDCDSIIYHLHLHRTIPGFSVSPNTRVIFAPGNLQYKATSSTNISWRFAPTQYDRRMADNASPSATANKWMDLFGWGTSGIGRAKKPYETSTKSTNYSWSEWGDNAIGDYPAKTWRTPTKDEWVYLFSTRKVNGAAGYSYVRLKTGSNTSDTVTGVLIYPDDFTWAKAGVTAIATGASAVQVVANDTWKKLEEAGCAFLPGCSSRNGTSVNANDYGRFASYWSATQNGTNSAYNAYFNFGVGSIFPASGDARYYGYAVRLVRDVE